VTTGKATMPESAGSPGEADQVRLAVTPLQCRGILATPESLRKLRHQLTAWALSAGLRREQAQDVALAGYEALANVADHAYPDGAGGVVDVEAAVRGNRIEVVVTDHGEWRQPVLDPRPVALRGRGLLLLRASADHADITTGDAGTVVTLGWDLV